MVSPSAVSPLVLPPSQTLGALRTGAGDSLLHDAICYIANEPGDGLGYRFPAGTLAEMRYLTAEALAGGTHLPVFILHLQEGDSGPKFAMTFSLLNQCSARIRIPLDCVTQNRWMYEREGAWLKPLCSGDRVDLGRVDRMTLELLRKSEREVCWHLTPFTATSDEPPKIDKPVLPNGPLLDELGQSTWRDWPSKSHDAKEVTSRLHKQLDEAPLHQPHAGFSPWGGWRRKRFEATGFFRTHHDGDRWWIVDPDGSAFWSVGVDCFGFGAGLEANFEGLEPALGWLPQKSGEYADIFRESHGHRSINYYKANFIRAFGPEDAKSAWSKIALGELRRLRFNTVANWSDWEVARQGGFPYVRPLKLEFRRTPMVFRDFPDVFHPGFAFDASAFAQQLMITRDDPAFIGYFLMNEPAWGFAARTPAEGMWLNGVNSPARTAFLSFLESRMQKEPRKEDFEDFSTRMVEALYSGLSAACRMVDPNHLNLGARYYTVPPDWAVAGMQSFDIFSVNCYARRVHDDQFAKISASLDMPILVGEWHFGALDAGLPASGIGHVRNQAARGQAYRTYIEDAASKPWCVGTHWFTMYDQSAIGRFDGENYNIGLFDVCNRPYEDLTDAARRSHERIYQIATGNSSPCADEPEYLPLLFT